MATDFEGHAHTMWQSNIELHGTSRGAHQISVYRFIGLVNDRIVVYVGLQKISERKVRRSLGDIEQQRTVERIKARQRELTRTHLQRADDELVAWIRDHGEAGV